MPKNPFELASIRRDKAMKRRIRKKLGLDGIPIGSARMVRAVEEKFNLDSKPIRSEKDKNAKKTDIQ